MQKYMKNNIQEYIRSNIQKHTKDQKRYAYSGLYRTTLDSI